MNPPRPFRKGYAIPASVCLSMFLVVPVFADGVAIVGTELADNGDRDGFADTLETVELRLWIRNTAGIDLHDVVLRLSSTAPEIACIGGPLIRVGDLAAGAVQRTDGAFVFTVGAVDRQELGLDALDALSVALEVAVSARELVGSDAPPSPTLELDLDVSGGGAPTTFFESFESGTFGAFEPHDIDATLHGLAASDGYRCQYSDPDWEQSNSYGAITDCFLGTSQAQAEVFHWQVHGPSAGDGGKAFSGNHSLYMGIFGPTAGSYTTPLAALEAVRSTGPINLDYSGPLPELSLVQQVDFFDSRGIVAFGDAFDRGVVALQLADETGQPRGDWIKLEPHLNVYDGLGVDNFAYCTFDPIDDGNTEDDFFDPTDPGRRFGPSSTCAPQRAFQHIGETSLSFDPSRIGNASDGPGLQGSLGRGTWVESRFSLDRFRGRRVRLRFLNTAMKFGSYERWADLFESLADAPGDDGWWIDDVMVTGALAEPATMTVDPKPNASLPGLGDGDGDGAIDACDACPSDEDPEQPDADGDGIGDACDTCPGLADPDRRDSDVDGLGDPCDPCPFGDGEDDDFDGVGCAEDSCRMTANADQVDFDDDGQGDACDACPRDSRNDQDDDGVCADVDDCPFVFDPRQNGLQRLSPPLKLSGIVDWFVVLPDGRRLLWETRGMIGEPTDGLFLVDPGKPEPLTALDDLGDGRGVVAGLPDADNIQFTPDGDRIVYLTQQQRDRRVYSASLEGGPPIRLSAPHPADRYLYDYRLAPDGTSIVYRIDHAQQEPFTGGFELYSVPVTGGAATHLTPGLVTGPRATQHEQFAISPDSTQVLFIARREDGDTNELYRVPIAGGAPTRLSAPLVPGGDVWSFAIAEDGSVIVYQADQDVNGSFELYAVHTAIPGPPFRLFSGNLLNTPGHYAVSPDGDTVVHAGSNGVFSVRSDGTSPVRLFSGLPGTVELSPDGTRVLLLSPSGLYSAPLRGGSTVRLSGPLTPGGRVSDFAFAPGGTKVVYLADERQNDVLELFAAPVQGGNAVRLNADLVAGGDVLFPPSLSSDGSMVLYRADQEQDGIIELYRVDIAGGPVSKVNGPLVPGGSVPGGHWKPQFLRAGSAVVYTAHQVLDGAGVFSVELNPDADGDGILAPCDCDDSDAGTYPAALDLPGDARDADCDGEVTCDPGAAWRNHGAYLRCVVDAVRDLVAQGRISASEGADLLRGAARGLPGAAPRFESESTRRVGGRPVGIARDP